MCVQRVSVSVRVCVGVCLSTCVECLGMFERIKESVRERKACYLVTDIHLISLCFSIVLIRLRLTMRFLL